MQGPDASEAVPVMVIVSLVILAPLVGDIMVRTGGVVSTMLYYLAILNVLFQDMD